MLTPRFAEVISGNPKAHARLVIRQLAAIQSFMSKAGKPVRVNTVTCVLVA